MTLDVRRRPAWPKTGHLPVGDRQGAEPRLGRYCRQLPAFTIGTLIKARSDTRWSPGQATCRRHSARRRLRPTSWHYASRPAKQSMAKLFPRSAVRADIFSRRRRVQANRSGILQALTRAEKETLARTIADCISEFGLHQAAPQHSRVKPALEQLLTHSHRMRDALEKLVKEGRSKRRIAHAKNSSRRLRDAMQDLVRKSYCKRNITGDGVLDRLAMAGLPPQNFESVLLIAHLLSLTQARRS